MLIGFQIFKKIIILSRICYFKIQSILTYLCLILKFKQVITLKLCIDITNNKPI